MTIQHATFGPSLPLSEEIQSQKHRQSGETFREAISRIANTLSDTPQEFQKFREILLKQAFLPGGRVQASIGSPRKTTAFNCFVSGTIPDSMEGIMEKAKESAQTMRLGGGIGYDFSTLRPEGDLIVSLDSKSSGPLSFMQIFDSICKTVASAGQRRGAQMGVLRVDHPDIEQFIEAKTNPTEYTQFNLSVGVTDEFMEAVRDGLEFPLVFEGRVYKVVDARYLWDMIMRATWDWAEPGILFIDRINSMNNLYYCEEIAATNPCGEQPLPPYGACLLGSFNLVKYLTSDRTFNWDQFKEDIPTVVRAMDNVVDKTTYPLQQQEDEAKSKRRMGLGITGAANCGETMGLVYGSDEFNIWIDKVLSTLTNDCYLASTLVAKEKGSFPMFIEEVYLGGSFIKSLNKNVIKSIKKYGIRNSHLTSIAPTGTISLSADNVSGGIEPVYAHSFDRTIKTEEGERVERIKDWAYHNFDVRGKTADECTPMEHLGVLAIASKWMDSAVSKTINIGDNLSWEDFKEVYMKAWEMGCKGCTTFRSAGQRYGILNVVEEEEEPKEGGACYIDLLTGQKECS